MSKPRWRTWRARKFYTANKSKNVPFDESSTHILYQDLPTIVTVSANREDEGLIDRVVDWVRCGMHVDEHGEALRRLATILESEGRSQFADVLRTILENPGAENENAKRFARARAERDRERLRKKARRQRGDAR